MTIQSIKPFFQKTYDIEDIDDLLEDFYEKLNAAIISHELGFNEGTFEVIINWRKE